MGITLGHYNSKENPHVHQVGIVVKNCYRDTIPQHFVEAGIFSFDICEISGYGASKEEAYHNYIEKMKVFFDEFNKIQSTILSEELKGDMVEMDSKRKQL